jgi:serine/threonine protein kinase
MNSVLSEQALDLAAKLLSLDPERRPTALEALQHPYFTTELPRPERPTGYILRFRAVTVDWLKWMENGMNSSRNSGNEHRERKIKN